MDRKYFVLVSTNGLGSFGKRETGVFVFHFDPGTSLETVLAEMAKVGCRPATKKERRLFYEQYPGEKTDFVRNVIGVCN